MRSGALAWSLAVLALLAAILGALAVGRFPIPPGALPQLALGRGDPVALTVLWNVRLPRVLAAMLVGGGLAAAGAAFQGMFRNPLASPDLLDRGEARVAEKVDGAWQVNQWLKKAVLLSFRLSDMAPIAGGPGGAAWWAWSPGLLGRWSRRRRTDGCSPRSVSRASRRQLVDHLTSTRRRSPSANDNGRRTCAAPVEAKGCGIRNGTRRSGGGDDVAPTGFEPALPP